MIHSSYHSLSISINMNNILLLSFIFFWYNYLILIYSILFIIILFIIWLYIFNWLNDLYIESYYNLTINEQLSLIYGIKLLIISELMLFFACFWCWVNFRFVSNAFSLFFSFPLLSCYSFSIPCSNLFILLFSSLPLQSTQIFIKIGFLNNTIESLAQALSCGLLFIVLQLKEFLYSYFSLSDCLIGSIFYFTTGLHGVHVVIGAFFLFLSLLFLTLQSIRLRFNIIYFMEYSFSLFLTSYYWHFIDWIWFCVFIVFIYSNIRYH